LLKGEDQALKDRLAWGKMRMDPTDIADVTGSTYTYLVNGHGPGDNWTGLFRPGERVRLRIVNASAMTTFNVRIPGLTLSIVQADGMNVRPVGVDEFQSGVAETYDVVVIPTEDRAYTLVGESVDRSGMARATLAPRAGMAADVPPLRKRPIATMKDMGMGMAGGAAMRGMDHGAMDMTMRNFANAPGVKRVPGVHWAFHCHMLYHMHAGMMQVVQVRTASAMRHEEGAARRYVPADHTGPASGPIDGSCDDAGHEDADGGTESNACETGIEGCRSQAVGAKSRALQGYRRTGRKGGRACHRSPCWPRYVRHAGRADGQWPGGRSPTGHIMPGMAMPTNATGEREGTDLNAGTAPAPPPAPGLAASRFYNAEAMAHANEALRREHGGMTYRQILFNLAEYQAHGGGRDGYRWDGEAWIGGDIDRLTLKSEGEGRFGIAPANAEVQALYSHALDPYWNVQAGVRQDFTPDPSLTYATLAIEGIAPFWFDVEGAVFLSDKGDVLARTTAWYDERVTQFFVLQPRIEADLAAQDVRDTGIGAGLTDLELGLRLRYEKSRQFAPYVGVSWERQFGATARFSRARGNDAGGLSFVAGVRTWF